MSGLSYDQIPPQVINELEKYGLKKDPEETMGEYVAKIRKHCHEVEKTI
jgi:hypothetical protein